MKSKKPADFILLVTVLVLLAIGTMMVFSSSTAYAYTNLSGSYALIKKQILYVGLGLVMMFFLMNVNYKKIGKLSPLLFVVTIILLILVSIPGVGTVLNGARRWIKIAGILFQPSEIAKLSTILFFAYSISLNKIKLTNLVKGLLPYLGIVGIIAFLLLQQPHFSATVLIVMVSTIILICAGARITHFILLACPAIIAGSILVFTSEYRMKRITSFLDPWSDLKDGGWQIVQSLYAIGSGGLIGRGLGKSLQKFLYIPEPYNDFILSVLAEELGFLGVFIVLTLFIIFIWRGIKIAINTPDKFGELVALGITSLIAMQVIINVAVVTSSMPVTGMPLPFFSYGGTATVFLLSGVGILLNISRYSNYEKF